MLLSLGAVRLPSLRRGSRSSPGSLRARRGRGSASRRGAPLPASRPPASAAGGGRAHALRGGTGTAHRTEGQHGEDGGTRGCPGCHRLSSSPPAPCCGCTGRGGAAPAPRCEPGPVRCPPASARLTLLYAPLFSMSPCASPCPTRAGAVLSRPGCGEGGLFSPCTLLVAVRRAGVW